MSFPSTPTNGQQAVVNDITYVYASATNTWTRLPVNIQDGATGPQGPQGPQGAAGPQGPQGQNGNDGATGQIGRAHV